MAPGGHMGFFTTHSCAHSDTNRTAFPDSLKGLDMVLWGSFTALNLMTNVRAVIDRTVIRECKDEETGSDDWEYRQERLVGGHFDRCNGPGEENGEDSLEYSGDEVLQGLEVRWLTEQPEVGEEKG